MKPNSRPFLTTQQTAKLISSIGARVLLISVLFLTMVFSARALAVEPVLLDPENAPFDAAKHAEYILEPRKERYQFHDRMLLPELIERAGNGEFKPVTTRLIGFGAQWSIVHVRIPIENLTDASQSWVLAFNRVAQAFNSVDLVIDGQPIPTEPILYTEELNDWRSEDVQLHVRFEVPARSTGSLYVTYSNGSSSSPMTIETVEGYRLKRRGEDIAFYMVVGLLVGLAFVSIALLTTISHPASIPYALYLLSSAVVLAVFDDYLFQGFLSDYRTYAGHIESIFIGFTVSSSFLFQRYFLYPPGKLGAYGNTILAAASITLLIATSNILTDFAYLIFITSALGLCFLMTTVSGLVSVFNRQRGGWPFLLGCIAISMSWLGKSLSYGFSAQISNLEASIYLRYAIVFETILFATAMFAQVRGMREEQERAMEAELRLTKEKLELSQALVTTAHDIQQPLASLRMALLGASAGKEKSSEIGQAFDYIEDIVRENLSGAKQKTEESSPVTDLVCNEDLSHDVPSDVNHQEDFSINLVIQCVATMFEKEAQAKNIELISVPSECWVKTSPLALMRIISNLVSNAVKNTDNGRVLIGCRRTDTKLRVEVWDTGQGFSVTQLTDLQKPYVRHGTYDGTGLGLSIVFDLCEEHDLEIEVASKLEKGTVFKVSIPRTGK